MQVVEVVMELVEDLVQVVLVEVVRVAVRLDLHTQDLVQTQ